MIYDRAARGDADVVAIDRGGPLPDSVAVAMDEEPLRAEPGAVVPLGLR